MQKFVLTAMNFILILTIISCSPQPFKPDAAEPLAIITVEAGEYTRIDTPISISLEGIDDDIIESGLRIEEIKGSERIPVATQIESGNTPKLWWILSGTTHVDSQRTFELFRSSTVGGNIVTATKGDRTLDIEVGKHKVLSYTHAIVSLPENRSPRPEKTRESYDRSGFIYPIWSPKGNLITEIHPEDHVHHFGVWMPWTHTRYEGNLVDFWNIFDETGTVRFSKYISTTEGPVYGGFQTEQDHVALKTSEGEKVIINEIWDVRVYNVGGPEKEYWIVDFKSTQKNITELPLIQEEYLYGGFAYRGAREWKGANKSYLTSEGKTQMNANATRSRWCDMSGAIDGEWEGVTVMSNPGNFQHPEPMRIIPEDDYVFFVYCPSVAGEWVMEPGDDHVFQYRLYIHEGKPDVENIERIWNDYAEPPKVKITTAMDSADAESEVPDNRIVLFDGTDFSHWVSERNGPIRWEIEDGAMKIVPGTGSIMTKENYRDFKMHVEFKLPELPPNVRGQARANSGVYIQRRYEVQILDSYGLEPRNNDCGAIYQFKAPDKNACAKPEEWQTYDITFRAARYDGDTKTEDARITVWQNGILIQDNVEIPNKTGAGRPEGPEPAPILLQDHSNEIWFRNIWIEPQ